MTSRESEYYVRAVDAIADREYETAGDALARAAWETLAEPRPGQGPFDDEQKGWAGEGIQYLLTSGVCYRVAGRPDRAESRGAEAGAIATDFESVRSSPVQRACLQELVADARLVGGLDDAVEAYADAADAYRRAAASIEDPHYWSTTPLFEAAATPLQQVARSTADGEIAISWEDLHGPDPSRPGEFLAHRATYKRRRFSSLLETVVADGYLAAPRGTTEYNNATHQCPRCGSNDVNWVGGSVLCLRCSTPTEQQ